VPTPASASQDSTVAAEPTTVSSQGGYTSHPSMYDTRAYGRSPQPVRAYPTQRKSSAARTFGKVIVAIVVIVVLLMVVPLPLPYNTTLESSVVNPGYSQLGSSDCISISGSWSVASGGSVTLLIVNNNGGNVYDADASSGSFSFNAPSGPYMVGALSVLPEVVQISGTCWGPLIQVGLP
jgi:hypothetical protein